MTPAPRTTSARRACRPLAALRKLQPRRDASLRAALRCTERQAERLLRLAGITEAPVSEKIITELPGVSVHYRSGIPVSGSCHWTGKYWIIETNGDEPPVQQRFTLFHELKHIVDHGQPSDLATDCFGFEVRELLADVFASCVLVPARFLRRAWRAGLRCPQLLADYFQVSVATIRMRLVQVGLRAPDSPDDEPAVDGGPLLAGTCLYPAVPFLTWKASESGAAA